MDIHPHFWVQYLLMKAPRRGAIKVPKEEGGDIER